METKKAMISQPMNGLSDEQILAVREIAKRSLENMGYEVVDTFFEDFNKTDFKHIPIAYLAKSIEALSQVDCLLCCEGWAKARGCKFEHDIAVAYGVDVIYFQP